MEAGITDHVWSLDEVIDLPRKAWDYEEHPPVGIRLHSHKNCPLDVWRFSLTRQYRICHRSGRLGDRVGYTLDFKLYHYPHEHIGDFKDS